VNFPSSLSAQTQTRKADHLRFVLDEDAIPPDDDEWTERYRFTHCCLPEIVMKLTDDDVPGNAPPLLISSMTGGTELAGILTIALPSVAQHCQKKAMGVGSSE